MNLSWKHNNDYIVHFKLPMNNWKILLESFDYQDIHTFLQDQLKTYGEDFSIYPPRNLVLNCFYKTQERNLKVVILGQDPYINENQAMGLAFSVPSETKLPPSLKNIYKKLNKNTDNGDLTHWAEQGVLLLNTALTVRSGKSNSHSKIWKDFTNQVIQYISNSHENIIFMLWGKNAYDKLHLINSDKHHVLISSHPSPLSYTKQMQGFPSFKDCNHFEECNKILASLEKDPIEW